MGWNSILWPHFPVANLQTLALRDVTSVRWRRLYPGHFGYVFVQWEKAAAHLHLHLSLCQSLHVMSNSL